MQMFFICLYTYIYIYTAGEQELFQCSRQAMQRTISWRKESGASEARCQHELEGVNTAIAALLCASLKFGG